MHVNSDTKNVSECDVGHDFTAFYHLELTLWRIRRTGDFVLGNRPSIRKNHCAGVAVTLISTLAPGNANSVMPIAVHAGQGSERNSSRTFMKART